MTKTGPAPLKPKEFALRWEERLNAKLIFHDREYNYRFKCNDCGFVRDTSKVKIRFSSCVCTHKRRFYTFKRTLETHNQELTEKKPEYKCLKMGDGNRRTAINRYKHKPCGTKFTMNAEGMLRRSVPCPKCVKTCLRKTEEEYIQDLAKAKPGFELLSKYCSYKQLKFKYPCGHIWKRRPDHMIRYELYCDICSPYGSWLRFRIGDQYMRVRSKPEKEFVLKCISKGVRFDEIRYEPKEYNIKYFDTSSKRMRGYRPDFVVRGIPIEIKDPASLGLRPYRYGSKKETLAGNRDKIKAARKVYPNFRLYVFYRTSGNFKLAGDFWKRSERERLLNLS